MKYSQVNYKGKDLKRITRKEVNKLINNKSSYDKNLIIYMLPVNANHNYMFFSFMELELNSNINKELAFTEIKEYEYYNCNNELGRYLKFYIAV